MELTAEEKVTRLLSSNEVFKDGVNLASQPFGLNSVCNLGEFLKNCKPEPSPYEGKYVFIR